MGTLMISFDQIKDYHRSRILASQMDDRTPFLQSAQTFFLVQVATLEH